MSCQRELEVAPLNLQFPEGSWRVSLWDPASLCARPGERGRLTEVHITLPSVEAQIPASPSLLSRNWVEFTPKCLRGSLKFSRRENSSH